MRKGDTVIVTRLDRLGRRMIKLIDLIDEFKLKGVQFISLDNNIDTSTPIGMLLFTMCAAFAEMERTLITERIKAGVALAHSLCRKGGRPRSLSIDKHKKLKSLIQVNDFSVTEICKMVGISRSVYYRSIAEFKNKNAT